MSKLILYVVNSPDFFISHRLSLALAAKEAGYEVHVATMSGKSINRITDEGFTHHVLPLTRSGKNIYQEVLLFIRLIQIFRQIRPRLVHLVTIKPVLYGGLAARMTSVPGVAVAISGLGHVFADTGPRASFIRKGAMVLYRVVFGKKNLRVIFQNYDDLSNFVNAGALNQEKAVLIRGSGVDLSLYPFNSEPVGIPVVIMTARLLRDKGVIEFFDAARIITQQGKKALFLLVGDTDPYNPATVTETELAELVKDRYVEFLGPRNDIAALLSGANIAVLPSYREGLPKALVEAAAAGRAVVTTDVPGCRDAIEPGQSGLLVPARDAISLAKAIGELIDDVELRQSMGLAGRQLAEREFSIEMIARAHTDIYRELDEKA